MIVPVKRLAEAKSRLSDELAPSARHDLVRAMLADVLAAARESAVGSLLLVSADDAYDDIAAQAGAVRVADAGTGYNQAVALGLAHAQNAGAASALVVPADQPRATASDIREASAALAGLSVVVVRAHDDGTGALGLRPPTALEPAFGPRSADAHLAAAERAGLTAATLALPSLAYDIDMLADLERVEPPLGPATRAWVETLREEPPLR